jgi:M6 family metalloprotease-like protein
MACVGRWAAARWIAFFLVAFLAAPRVTAQAREPGKWIDLAGYRTVESAITTTIKKTSASSTDSPGYLGVLVEAADRASLRVTEVVANSPASRSGLKIGDQILRMDGRHGLTPELFRTLLQTRNAGDQVKLHIRRGESVKDVTATLTATSRALRLGQKRARMGVFVDDTAPGDGAPVKYVFPNSPAAKAGLKPGDVILKLNNVSLGETLRYGDALHEYKPGDSVKVMVQGQAGGKPREMTLTLIGETVPVFPGKGSPGTGSWDTRFNTTWKKNTFRLAVVGIEFSDVKRNAAITTKNWAEAIFSVNTYTKQSVTGQKTFGSLHDYYLEQSFKKLKVLGKCFDFVTVAKKRFEYATAFGQGKTAVLGEALAKLYARDGKDALKGYDGIFFIYAGDRAKTNRGGLFWPHKGYFFHQGKRWNYFIVPEGGERMTDNSVICHEFGHMLGLPDLYARPENPGSEGAGLWCAMSNQTGGGRPQHFSAWSKERLGWITPALIDPTIKQKLILAPIQASPKECYKILARPDGSEYFLLENRQRKGFDQSLPGEGMLIWRVVGNRPILEESHGIQGPAGPRVFLDAVPFPSPANNAFTPYTTPSSRAQLGGGLPVHITNIRRLRDGRIAFQIGYEYY